jgi:hypothetical protein
LTILGMPVESPPTLVTTTLSVTQIEELVMPTFSKMVHYFR